MKPRKNFRSRPKKTGAVRNQRTLSQKRRLVAIGYKQEKLDKMTTVELRDLVKKGMKKQAKEKRVAKSV